MKRSMFLLLGFALVALGVAGMLLPLLPTTIFFILAAGCFARSSPRLEARILAHPTLGPSVRLWREHGVIPPRAKLFAVVGISVGFVIFLLSAHPTLLTAGLVAVLMTGCAAYVVSRPSYPKV